MILERVYLPPIQQGVVMRTLRLWKGGVICMKIEMSFVANVMLHP